MPTVTTTLPRQGDDLGLEVPEQIGAGARDARARRVATVVESVA